MNIRDLEYLVALAEHRHFRKAAEACFVSQPTLSGQIRKLEDELGVSLLERTSRRVLFTDAGMRLVQQARNVLREVTILTELASEQGESMTGPLHIGLIPTVGPYLLPKIIPMLRDRFPELELFIHEGQTQQLVQQLEEGKLDCIILASVEETQHLKELPLYEEPMLLAVSEAHKLAGCAEVALDVLQGETLLMLGDGHCLRDQAMGFCFKVGAREDQRFRATSLETLRNMVAAGSGITLLPRLSVPAQRRDGVAYIPTTSPTPTRQITLDYRPGSPLRGRYEQLAEVIREHMVSVMDTPLSAEPAALNAG
ncbi:DNA-binding transcriptional regulator OxyR [Salinivibrio proteolyticus]|uniref:DNA-binding transcriptional regulator OxyR n=1 Tax=Salinivibrio proteolyticus TaxID=334715 RepID=UPI000988CBC7|nr:DNA-binding transcriptional regulator OxyR [Salinivibrio proteolyticus]OOF27236.1 DNA-binding transcriptional regulator OxyR [Salinivibrio proteolyticus]